MRIDAISSSNYLPSKNINNKKNNNNPSFGEITNIAEIKGLVQQDVANGKVTQEFANSLIAKLGTVKFNLKECVEQYYNYLNTSIGPKTAQNYSRKIDVSLLPLLKENNINYEDLPVKLTNFKVGKPNPWNDDFYCNNAYFRSNPDAKVYSFSVKRAFDNVQYDIVGNKFTIDKNDEDRKLFQPWAAVSLYSCFTELLNDYVDNKDLEALFYDQYAYHLFNYQFPNY